VLKFSYPLDLIRVFLCNAERVAAGTPLAITALCEQEEAAMNRNKTLFEVNRRAMLSAAAMLPALPVLLPIVASADVSGDPLPSWNDTPNKKAIVAFVERVTKQSSPEMVPEDERIATFDNDGTLWAEQPIYFQLAFALDRVKGACRAASRMEGQRAFCLITER
jgi:hypothetical protein